MSKKLTGFRIDDELKDIGWDCIKVRSIVNKNRPENFSEFLRNLIYEEWDRNKTYLIENDKKENNK